MEKPTLIVLHGALGSKKQLKPLLDVFNKSFNVRSFNFEGHGGEPLKTNFGMDNFACQLLKFLDDHDIDQTFVFGYSMGGYVALKAALIKPQKFKAIATLGTKFDWTKETAAKEIKNLNPDVIEAKVPRFALVLKERHQPLVWKDVLANTAQMLIDLGNGTGRLTKDMEKLEIPVNIGLGTEDNMVSKEESLAISTLLPKGEFNLYQGFPHPIEKVDVEVLTSSVEKWLLKVNG